MSREYELPPSFEDTAGGELRSRPFLMQQSALRNTGAVSGQQPDLQAMRSEECRRIRLNHDSLDSQDYFDYLNHGNPIIPKIMVQIFLRRLNHDSLDSHDYLDYLHHGNPIILQIMVQI